MKYTQNERIMQITEKTLIVGMALSNKLIRIFYMILTKNVAYDPQKMMNDIRRPEVKAA